MNNKDNYFEVMESEQEKCHAEKEHLETAHLFTKAGKELQDLKTKLKTAINKSRVYFDLKTKYMDQLEAHKKEVISLQGKLKVAKKDYSMSLRKLEGISDEIHEVRQSRISLCLPSRESGVGAECPGHQAPSEGRTARDWDEDGMMVLPDGRCDDSDKSTTDSTRGDTSESIPDAVCDDTSKSIPDPVCDNLDESPKISTMDRASDVSPASGACNDTAESALDAVCGDLGELPSEGTIDDFSEST